MTTTTTRQQAVRSDRAVFAKALALASALVWALAQDAWAQTTSSSLSGVVATQLGQPVEAATVLARSLDRGGLRQSTTDAQGFYRIDSLTPGTWHVSVTLPDGSVSPAQVVQLRLQQALSLDFRVVPGVSERVTVTAQRPLVDRMETAGSLRIGEQQVSSLPLSGRVFTDLALLDSSVGGAAPGNFFGERGSVFVVHGQSGRSNSFLVDGLDNNDQVSGTTLNSFFSQQVIQEFVLLTHQYAPEFGRAAGGVLNVVTRRGSNDHDWSLFLQGSSQAWNSSGEFVDALPQNATSRDALSRFQGGLTWGGPIKKDKAFFFLAYEHQTTRDLIPYSGVDREGVAGGRFDPRSTDDNVFLRTDFNLGARHNLMVRLSADDRITGGVNVGGLNGPEWGFRIEETDLDLGATLTSVLGPRTVNETRLLVAASSFDQFANSERPGVTRPSGVFGGNNLNRQLRDEKRLQLVENLTLSRGDHTLKFGLDIAHSETRIRTKFNPNGNLIYNTDSPFEPGDCGDLFLFLVQQAAVDGSLPLVPCPGVVGVDDDGDGQIDEPGNIDTYPVVFQFIEGEPDSTLRDTKIALFAQDRWQATPKLLLDYGLRYDLSTFSLGEDVRVESTIPNGGAGRDYDNLAPRFGFTFTPKRDGRTLIRGGGGIFYDKLVLGFPAVASITSGTEIGLTFPQGLTIEVTESFIEDEGIDVVRPTLFFPEELTLRFSTATRLATPYTVQYNAGMERTVGQHGAVRANVVRALGYHQPLMTDLNPVVCLPEENPLECPLLPVHRDPQTGSIAAIVTEGRSWYTGVDAQWRWQRDEAWFSASYTWSRGEDLGFDPLRGGISLPPNPDDLNTERGPTDGDRRNRLVVSGDFGLGWLDLRVAGVAQLASGIPFNVTTGTDENLDGVLTERPDGVGRNTGADTSLATINAFRDGLNQQLLAAGAEPLPTITSLREPSFSQIDVRLYRPFRWSAGRGGQGEWFLQVINVLDRENAGLIEGRLASRNFGQPIGLSGPPRIVEIGLRIGG